MQSLLNQHIRMTHDIFQLNQQLKKSITSKPIHPTRNLTKSWANRNEGALITRPRRVYKKAANRSKAVASERKKEPLHNRQDLRGARARCDRGARSLLQVTQKQRPPLTLILTPGIHRPCAIGITASVERRELQPR